MALPSKRDANAQLQSVEPEESAVLLVLRHVRRGFFVSAAGLSSITLGAVAAGQLAVFPALFGLTVAAFLWACGVIADLVGADIRRRERT